MLWRPSYHTRIAQAGDFLTAEASFIAAYYLADFLHSQFPYFFPRTAPLQTSQLLVVLVIGFCYVVLFGYQHAYSYIIDLRATLCQPFPNFKGLPFCRMNVGTEGASVEVVVLIVN